jgi:hypothetical protein
MPRFADDDDDDWDEPRRVRRRRRDEEDDGYAYDRPLPHSGLGIAACVIAAGVLVCAVVIFAVAGLLETSRPGGIGDDSTEAAVLGGLLLIDVVAALIGLVLGIVGVAQHRRNKLFAGIGLGANALLLLGLLALFVIGAIFA